MRGLCKIRYLSRVFMLRIISEIQVLDSRILINYMQMTKIPFCTEVEKGRGYKP